MEDPSGPDQHGWTVINNLAVHYDGKDMRTNFNIYDLDPETGEFKMIREGCKDQ